MWKPRNTCFYLISQCSPSLLLITGSFVGIRRQRLILQYYFLSVHLRQTGILRYIKLSKLQSLKRRQDLSKMACELIRAQAGRVINNKTILCKVSVAPVIVGNYVNETNNSSVNFGKFPGANGAEFFGCWFESKLYVNKKLLFYRKPLKRACAQPRKLGKRRWERGWLALRYLLLFSAHNGFCQCKART